MADGLEQLLRRGKLATRQAEHKKALALFRRANEIDDTCVDALLGIALASTRLGRDNEATAAYLALAELCIRKGKLDNAQIVLERVLAREPDNRLALRFRDFVRERSSPEVNNRLVAGARGTGDDWGTECDEARFEDELETNVADVFAADPTETASDDLLRDLIDRCRDPDSVVAGIERLAGARLSSMNDWERATTVAVAGAHLAQLREQSSQDGTWNESDFPSYDEAGFEAPARTIHLGGAGVVLDFVKMAARSPLLSLLDRPARQLLLSRSDVLQSFVGQELARAGEKSAGLKVLITGRAVLEWNAPPGRSRRRAFQAETLEPGDFFGEGAALGGGHDAATVRVTEDALILEITEPVLREIAAARPEVLRLLTRTLRRRFVATLFGIHGSLAKSPRERDEFGAKLELRHARVGGVIKPEGATSNGLWFLLAGELERWNVGHSIKIVSPQAFGISIHTGEIVATRPSWLLWLAPTDAAELFHRHPEAVAELS